MAGALASTAVATPAVPTWNGDTFTLNTAGTKAQGGEGTLPPYQWSSSWESGLGFISHSNTDPTVHGATMVSDPGGLSRNVIKLNNDASVNNGTYSRIEVRGAAQFGDGDEAWLYSEVFIPDTTPTMPNQSDWWTILSSYGSPYAGASQNSFHLHRNAAGTGNDITWNDTAGNVQWHVPATEGVWHEIARKIKYSTNSAVGYSEVWYGTRDASGVPTGPMTQQTIVPHGTGTPTTHYNYLTLDSTINWDGHMNHFDVKNYHKNMTGFTGKQALYFARTRTYSGSTAIADLDPYYESPPVPAVFVDDTFSTTVDDSFVRDTFD